MEKEFQIRLEKIESALKGALAASPFSFGTLDECVTGAHLRSLLEPNEHLISLGGKRWRPLLMILCREFAEKTVSQKKYAPVDEDTAYSLVPLVEFVHTASLIHDDIEDSADLRRGEPAAHLTYGLDTALNAASWLYFEAPFCLDRANLPDGLRLSLYKLYAQELRRLHLGQAMDIFWHRNKEVFPSLDEYKAMVRCKTGTLSSLAAQCGMLCGGASESQAAETGKTAAEIGVGFQIIDDVINLTTGNAGKKRGDDIVEGKKSLPILLHLKKFPEDTEKITLLLKAAAKDGIGSPAVEECIAMLEAGGCIGEAATEGKRLIYESCARFSGSELIPALFRGMIPEAFR